MNVFIIVVACVAWATLGITGTISIWTKKYDFTTEDLMLLFAGAIGGPIMVLIMASLLRDSPMVIKKRTK